MTGRVGLARFRVQVVLRGCHRISPRRMISPENSKLLCQIYFSTSRLVTYEVRIKLHQCLRHSSFFDTTITNDYGFDVIIRLSIKLREEFIHHRFRRPQIIGEAVQRT